MKTVATVHLADAADAAGLPELPEEIQLAMTDIAGVAREGLLAMCGFRRNGALHPKVLAHLFRPIWRGWWGRGLGASATVGLPSHLLRVVWLLSLPGRGVSWSLAVMISHVRSRRCSATRQAGEQ